MWKIMYVESNFVGNAILHIRQSVFFVYIIFTFLERLILYIQCIQLKIA